MYIVRILSLQPDKPDGPQIVIKAANQVINAHESIVSAAKPNRQDRSSAAKSSRQGKLSLVSLNREIVSAMQAIYLL